jgi:hypothetical protein
MRMSLVLPLVAALTVVAIGASSPVAAKPMNCQTKHRLCEGRCIMNTETLEQQNACLRRTCDHQRKNCESAERGTEKSGSGRTREKVVRDKRGRVGGVTRATPATQSPPNVQPRPMTASSGTNGSGQPVVRDHRVKRAGSGWDIR